MRQTFVVMAYKAIRLTLFPASNRVHARTSGKGHEQLDCEAPCVGSKYRVWRSYGARQDLVVAYAHLHIVIELSLL